MAHLKPRSSRASSETAREEAKQATVTQQEPTSGDHLHANPDSLNKQPRLHVTSEQAKDSPESRQKTLSRLMFSTGKCEGGSWKLFFGNGVMYELQVHYNALTFSGDTVYLLQQEISKTKLEFPHLLMMFGDRITTLDRKMLLITCST